MRHFISIEEVKGILSLMVNYSLKPFHQQILKKVCTYGDAIALTDDNEQLSFREVFKRSYQMAILLDSMYILKGEPILVTLPNSIWYPIVFLGAAVIGCPLVGINHESTSEEVQYCMKKSGAKAAICDERNFAKLRTVLPVHKIAVLTSNAEHSDWTGSVVLPRDLPFWDDHLPGFFEDVIFEPDDVLLLPFSSGTSGRPHCVKLTHRNFSAATAILKTALFDKLVMKSRRKTVAVLPFYHASGFWALLYSLLEKCHTIIMKSFHPVAMLEIIHKHQVDTLNVVPSILSFLCRVNVDGYNLSSVRTVLCGSSPLGKELSRSFLEKFHSVQNLIQGYGMTEVVLLSHITPLGLVDEKYLGSCGKLLPGFEAELRDENGLKIVGPNCPGELFLKSPTVALGYRDSDEEENAFNNGWLRTGDVLYYNEDGFYFVVDRVKDLIKVNGVQISPSELEDIILTDPCVRDVGVIGIEHPESGQVPKAFIVVEDGADGEKVKEGIMALIKVKVAPTKHLRGGVEIVSELPKTSSGKVKRSELRLHS